VVTRYLLERAFAAAVGAAIARPDTQTVALEGHQRDQRAAAHTCLAVERAAVEPLVDLEQAVLDIVELSARRCVAFQTCERLDDHAARDSAVVMSAHAVRDDPQADIRVIQNGVLVVATDVPLGSRGERAPGKAGS